MVASNVQAGARNVGHWPLCVKKVAEYFTTLLRYGGIFTNLLLSIRNFDKNSSGDEIANVNFYAVRPGSYPNSLK